MKLFQTITEGGQLTTHSVRMFKQVTKTSFFITFILWIVVFLYQMRDVNTFYLQNVWHFEQARFYQVLHIKTIKIDPSFGLQKEGPPIKEYSTDQVLRLTKPYADRFYRITKRRFQHSAFWALAPLSVVFAIFFFRGRQSIKKHHLKGNTLSSVWLTRWKLKLSRRASPISIGPLPLIKGTETQHIMITGGTGSGKTNCLHHLLKSVRQQKQRAIIVDTTGLLTERYYRAGKDILLNPLDSRGAPWHPWIECTDKTSYATMAESFIPQSLSESDNYWRTSARIVLGSLFEQLKDIQKNSTLADKILRDPLQELCDFVQGTKAASLIDMNSEKTAASIRAVMSNFLTCFELLANTDQSFSIREWIQQDNPSDEWLFISCKTNEWAALNPLLSCWLSVAVRSLLALSPDFNRRLWYIIDELPTLNRLRDLDMLLAESRKYGGCAVLALQSPAQLEAIYGQAVAQTLIGNCATKIVFAEQNPLHAGRLADMFGEQEIREYQKGLSYGANDIRDGVSLNQQTRYQQLITKTDIQFLSRNQAFVRLPDNCPVVRLKVPILPY
ncbi:type IV conjugative transfer system coupling protein TraD [Candidatus Protochlamydia amoebophila]|nr:type IV conjugative transfer system coupling protein TraD [Candidatus Protochlamydia amoebophila]